MHHARPDQVLRAQELEGAGHLLGVEIALAPHQVLQEVDLAFIDEERQLSGLGEILLGGKKRDALQPLIAVAGHGAAAIESSVPPRQ